jgi:AcrR family transcriptional regulator
MDRRERRKVEKRQLIHESAVQLARDNGVGSVTIDAICAAAGVSQRTFFNYFAFKEAVFVFPPPPLPEEATARFAASTNDLTADLTDLMVAQAEEMSATPWLGPLMREINQAHPRLMPLQVAEFEKFQSELQGLIAGRLGVPFDDIRAMALAGAVSGATRTAIRQRRDAEGAHLPTIMRETLDALFNTIRARG